MKRIILSIMMLFALSVYGQNTTTPFVIDWTKMTDNSSNANFYDVQNAFKQHWEGKQITKGCGYKPFKRWEAYMAPRVYPSGNMILPHTNYSNFMKWENRQTGPKSISGNWTALGPVGKPSTPSGQEYRTGTGRINFIRVDPTDSLIIFVGAPDGGVWKSTDGGVSWTTNTDFLGVIGCNDLVFDPNNTQIMYLATGDIEGDRRSIGILKSTDGGNTWNPTSLTWTVQQNMKTSRLLMDPNNSLKMLVATSEGTFSTTDGWATNTGSSFPGGAVVDLKSAELKTNNPDVVYASGTKLYKSINFGANWLEITSGVPTSNVSRISLAVSEDDPNVLYAVYGEDDQSLLGIYKSTNSGASFSTQFTDANAINLLGYELDGSDMTSGQAFYDLVIAANPTDANNITVSSINQWQSNDGGLSWDIISHWTGDGGKPTIHSDFHEITYQPGSSTTLYAGSDGGIWRSRDNGVTWTDLSNNLNISQINKFGISQSDSTLINAGMQDNGTNFRNNTSWNNIFGGDGGESFIDHSDNNTLYFCYTNSEIHRSDDGGITSNQVTTGLPNGGPSGADFYSSFHQDPVLANRVYAGGHPELYVTNDKGDNWTMVGTPQGSGNITEFSIAPINNQVMYVVKYDAVSKSTNGGTSFTDITGTLPVSFASPSMVTVSKHDENKVWVVFSGYSDGDKVFQSTNGGTTWTNISTGLPNLPMNTVVSVENSVNDAIYVGGDIGVYYYDNSMTAFTPFFTDLPRASVRDLEIHYATRKLRAATYGRGVWQSDLNSNTIYDLNISCNGTNNTCNGASIGTANVSVISGNSPYTYSWSNGDNTDSINNLIANNYSVTVTDAQNQVKTCTYVVTEPIAIAVNCSGTEMTSVGANDGTAMVDPATGGTNTSVQTVNHSFPGAPFSVDAPSGNATATSTIMIPAVPTGAVITSATLNIDTYTALGNSWGSDAYISLSGAYTLSPTQLASGMDNPGVISPNPTISLTSFPTAGGNISFLIDEPTNDPGVDATISGVSIDIIYTLNGYTYLWSNGATTTSLSGLSAGPYTITVTDAIGCTNSCTYNVNSPGANHNITASTGTNGTISPVGVLSITNHADQTYTFTANSCYEVESVLIDGVNNPAAVSAGTYTFTNVTVDHTINVTFKLLTNTIIASADGNGTVSSLGSTSVNCDADQTYTFAADACYEIEFVLIDGVNNPAAVSAGTYTFTNVITDHTIEVDFKVLSNTITATTGANGSITPVGATTVNCGTNQVYTFTANSCYEVESVLIDGVNDLAAVSAGNYTFTNVTVGHTIEVTFKPLLANEIIAYLGANGSITPSGTTSVNCGADQTFTFTADACYEIDSVWIDDIYNNGATTAGTYTFTNVTSDHTIEVTFKSITPETPTITLAGLVLTSDAPTGNQWYNTTGIITGETNQSYTATASDTYHSIVTVGGCSSDLSNSIDVVIPSTGIQTINGNEVNIYPNPVYDELVIEIKGSNKSINYEIINVEGKIVLSGTMVNKVNINTGNLSRGTYVVKLQDQDAIEFKKLIKK